MEADLRPERTAWVLNLDADVELGRGRGYAPTKAVRAAMEAPAARLATALLERDDIVVDRAAPPGSARGFVGRAFCPTPTATAELRRAGAAVAPHPSFAIVREANGRAFCTGLGSTLPGASFVRDLDVALALLEHPPSVARSWRLKRAFGMAGRGQRPVAPGVVSDGDRAFLKASIETDGGIQIEPNVAIERELAVHGWVAAEAVRIGRLTEQRCDAHGQWLSTAPAASLDDDVHAALEREAHRVAAALGALGYFGPFGIDSFLYRDLDGRLRLQPRSEINARYSMGWAMAWDRPWPK